MKKKLIAAGVVLALLLVLWGMNREEGVGGSTPRRRLTAEVKKGPMVITVKGSGTIQAVNPNKIMPLIKRQATITFLSPEGSRAAKGEVIARLNTDDIDRDISLKETAVMEATNKLYAAVAALDIQRMDNIANLADTQQKLKAAELDLEQYRQGDGPVDILDAELAVQTAQSELDRAQATYEDGQELLKEEFATKNDLEEWRMDLEKKRGALETASMKLNALKKFGQPVKQSGKQGALESAKANFEKAQKQSETQLQSKKKDVEVAQINLERAEKDLDIAREDRRAYEIKAPVAGLVNYGDPDFFWYRREVQVGGAFSPGRVLLNIPDLSAMKVVVPILEADVSQIKLGQKATVTLEAMPGKILHGEVSVVPEVASRSDWLEGNQFKVEILISDGKDLKTGLSCEAEIVTGTIDSAVYLPIAAVFQERNHYFVYPVKGRGDKKVDVTIGKASIEYVEIQGGVAPGAKVFLLPPDVSDEKK